MKVKTNKPKEEQIYYYKDGKCCISSDEPFNDELMEKYGNPEAKTWDEHDAIINPPPTDEQLAQQAQSEMITELNWCDLQLKYHATGDTKRAISTTELINAYAVDCRDYVQNVDGVLTIVGDKPERPE